MECVNELSREERIRLDADYEVSRQITARHGTTYYLSTLLFPHTIRQHVFGLYGFVRQPDEIVDNPAPNSDHLLALEEYRVEAMRAMKAGRSDIPILNAFARTAMTCNIPLEYPAAFLEAMFMDLTTSRYESIDDLQSYAYGSASVVGLMMCKVLGVSDQAALAPACDLGFAMQLTNFLRDIGEDWKMRRRIYLPREDLARFAYTEDELARGVVNDNFRELMRFEIERARLFYAQADKGMKYIPARCRRPVLLARALYSKILDKIEQNDYDVFTRRARTTTLEKAMELARLPIITT